MFGTFVSITYLFQAVDGYSPLRSGIAFLPLMVLNGLASPQLASRLMPYVPTRLLIVPGLLAAAVGVALLTRLTPESAFLTHVLPTEILLGVGLGVAMVPVISTATSNADPGDVGVISAMSTTSQQIGASIGTALLNTIAASAVTSYLASHRGGDAVHATVHGYATASAWAAGILALAALVAGLLINVHPGRAHAAQTAGSTGDRPAAQPSRVAPLVPTARGEQTPVTAYHSEV